MLQCSLKENFGLAIYSAYACLLGDLFWLLKVQEEYTYKPITVGPRDISKLFHVHICTEAYRTLKEFEPPHVSKANKFIDLRSFSKLN